MTEEPGFSYTFTLTRAQLTEGVEAASHQLFREGRSLLGMGYTVLVPLLIVAGCLGVSGAVAVLVFDTLPPPPLSILISAALGVIIGLYGQKLVMRDMIAGMLKYPRLHLETRTEIGPQGLVSRSFVERTEIAWAAVEKVGEARQSLLFHSSGMVFILPYEHLDIPRTDLLAQIETWREAARARALDEPFLQ
jgi:hypothetical protein